MIDSVEETKEEMIFVWNKVRLVATIIPIKVNYPEAIMWIQVNFQEGTQMLVKVKLEETFNKIEEMLQPVIDQIKTLDKVDKNLEVAKRTRNLLFHRN